MQHKHKHKHQETFWMRWSLCISWMAWHKPGNTSIVSWNVWAGELQWQKQSTVAQCDGLPRLFSYYIYEEEAVLPGETSAGLNFHLMTVFLSVMSPHVHLAARAKAWSCLWCTLGMPQFLVWNWIVRYAIELNRGETDFLHRCFIFLHVFMLKVSNSCVVKFRKDLFKLSHGNWTLKIDRLDMKQLQATPPGWMRTILTMVVLCFLLTKLHHTAKTGCLEISQTFLKFDRKTNGEKWHCQSLKMFS